MRHEEITRLSMVDLEQLATDGKVEIRTRGMWLLMHTALCKVGFAGLSSMDSMRGNPLWELMEMCARNNLVCQIVPREEGKHV